MKFSTVIVSGRHVIEMGLKHFSYFNYKKKKGELSLSNQYLIISYMHFKYKKDFFPSKLYMYGPYPSKMKTLYILRKINIM